MRRALAGVSLLYLSLALFACPSAPPKLRPAQFQDTVASDTSVDQDTTVACQPSCSGELPAEGWVDSFGWTLEDNAVRDGDAFVIGGAGSGSAVLGGEPWTGGFELTVTFSVLNAGDNDGKLVFGVRNDADTVRADVRLGTTDTVRGTAVGQGPTATEDLAIDASGEVTVTLTATCDDLTVAVGADTATKAPGWTLPDVGTLFLSTTGGASVRVTSVALANPQCDVAPAQCDCKEVADDCSDEGCTALGLCTEVALEAGQACVSDDPCTVGAGTCDGGTACVSAAKDCADSDPCTADSCDAKDGECLHEVLPPTSETGVDLTVLKAAFPKTTGVDDNDDALEMGATLFDLTSPVADGDGDIAVSAWVKPTAYPEAGSRGDIASQTLKGGGGVWFCGLRPNGHAQLGTTSGLSAVSDAPLPLDRWTHVSCSYDAATDALILTVADGAPVGAPVSTDAAGGFAASETSPLWVGGDAGGTNHFEGAVDGLQVWTTPIRSSPSCDVSGCGIPLCAAGVGCVDNPRGVSGCDDGNDCTTDACVQGGCTNTARDDGVSCDDGDPCSSDETCVDGSCVPAVAECPAIVCMDNVCDPVTGCDATPVSCVDDDDPCTVEACDPTAGDGAGACTSTYIPNCFTDLDGWAGRVELGLFEPPSTSGEGVMGPPGDGDLSEVSSWARAGEPIEVPLWPGLQARASVVAYFRMETSATGLNPQNEEHIGIPDELSDDRILGAPDNGNGSTPVFAPGVFGDAWALIRPNGVQLSLTSTHTLMAWIQLSPDTPSTDYQVLATGSMQGMVRTPAVVFGVVAGSPAVSAGGTTIPLDMDYTWHHVAFSFDATAAELTVYLDGELVDQQTINDPGATGQVFAGGEVAGLAPADAPLIDELVVCDEIVSADVIASVASAGLPALDSVLAGGVTIQADYDDLAVYRADPAAGPTQVPHEVIGRRPHSDSGDGVAGVLGYWRFDAGALDAAYFAGGDEVVSSASLNAVDGVFGDANGAVVPLSASAALDKPWLDDGPFSVELWVKTEDSGTCDTTTDGAVLLQTINGFHDTRTGWALRICGDVARFDHTDVDQDHVVTGQRRVNDGAWHHVMVSFDGDGYALVVDGILDGYSDYDGDVPLDGSLNAATVLYAMDESETAGSLTDAAIDEVLFHDRARSLAYAYNRVYPMKPALRFLAATSDSGTEHQLPHYALYAGDAAATGTAAGTDCDTLLECDGWAAWWPFDVVLHDSNLDVSITPDVAGGHHLDLDGASLSPEALSGNALMCDGTRDLTVLGDGIDLTRWNIEAGVFETGTGAQSILARPGAVGAAYALALTGTGQVSHGFGAESIAAAGVLSDAWSFLGGSYDGDPATLVAYSAGSDTEETKAPNDPPPTGTGGIHVCADEAGGAPFEGRLDDLRVMRRPLSPAERLKYPALTWQILGAYTAP